jgi:superfamily II DNA/RNA helicase
MASFKAGKKDVLIATDVASRGIDVDDVTHVINHTIPEDEKTYLHRAGRTGRAGKTGISVTFVDWDDLHKWALINRALEMNQPEPVETYSSSPHLYADMDIPADAKGRIKRTPAAKEHDPDAKPPRERAPQTGQQGSQQHSGQQHSGEHAAGDRPPRTRTRNRSRSRRPATGGTPGA